MTKLVSTIRQVTNGKNNTKIVLYGALIAASGYIWGIRYMFHLMAFCLGIIAVSYFFTIIYAALRYKVSDKKESLTALGLLVFQAFLGYFFLNYVDWLYILGFSVIAVGIAAYQSK